MYQTEIRYCVFFSNRGPVEHFLKNLDQLNTEQGHNIKVLISTNVKPFPLTILTLGKIAAAALARAAGERAAAAVGEDHRGGGEQDWDGEVVDVCVQDVCQCHIAPRPNTKYEVPNRISKKVQGNVVLGSRVVAGTLREEKQGGKSEQEAEDGNGKSEEVES